jgi:hypothetical protein
MRRNESAGMVRGRVRGDRGTKDSGGDMKTIGDFFWILFHPDYWTMNHPYSPEWDKIIRETMKVHKFVVISKYEARIGSLHIWIENHPYASFGPCEFLYVRPSRITIRDAREQLIKDLLEGTG